MSIVRESSWRSSASSSASSTTHVLALRDLPALDDLVGGELAVVHRAPALLLDRRQALAVQQPEGDVRLARSRLRRRREPDGDAHETEAQRSVPGDAHDPPSLGAGGRDSRRIAGSLSPIRASGARRAASTVLVDGRKPDDPSSLARGARPQHRDGVPRGRGRHAGARSRGPRRRERVELSRTACSPAASARATRSGSSRARPWSGRCLDFALGHIGAIGVGIYANSSPKDVAVRARALRGGRRASARTTRSARRSRSDGRSSRRSARC